MTNVRGLSRRTPLLALAVGASSFFATKVHAQQFEQLKTQPPNVLLLLDTSNSMNKTLYGADPECNIAPYNLNNVPAVTRTEIDTRTGNRWMKVIQVLGGTIPRPNCIPVDRDLSAFSEEYQIAGRRPYDAESVTKYFRPISTTTTNTRCTLSPRYLPGSGAGLGVGGPTNPYFGSAAPGYNSAGVTLGVFDRNAIRGVPTYVSTTAGPTNGLEFANFGAAINQECAFEVLDNGMLDYGSKFMRFGLMTYDTDTDNTAVSSLYVGATGGSGSAAYSYSSGSGPACFSVGGSCTGYNVRSSDLASGRQIICCALSGSNAWTFGRSCVSNGTPDTSTKTTANGFVGTSDGAACSAFAQYCPTVGGAMNSCVDGAEYSCCADHAWTNSNACKTGAATGTNYAQYCSGGAAQCGLASNGTGFSSGTSSQGTSNTVKGFDCVSINRTGTTHVMDAANPFLGQWSYIPSNGPSFGNLPTCTPLWWEVGARHRAAPPWEGPHIPFPRWAATESELVNNAANIKSAIRSMRPYGATPIAGQLRDAMDNLLVSPWQANSRDADPYLTGGCRKQYNILLSDGDPNMDMREECLNDPDSASGATDCMYGNTAGRCPFKRARKIVEDMYNGDSTQYGGAARGAKYGIKTFIIGFATSGADNTQSNGFPAALDPPATVCGLPPALFEARSCTGWRLYANGCNPEGNLAAACASQNPAPGTAAAACCKLDELARYGSGGTGFAYFADNGAQLVAAFQAILDEISRGETTKTVPAYAPPQASADATTTSATSAIFRATFNPRLARVWTGDVLRQRQKCDTGNSNPATNFENGLDPNAANGGVVKEKGDSFAFNLSNATTWQAPKRFLIVNTDGTGKTDDGVSLNSAHKDHRVSLRPYVTNEGAVVTSFGWETGTVTNAVGTSTSHLNPWNFEVDDNTCKAGLITAGYAGNTTPNNALAGLECSQVMWNFVTSSFETRAFDAPYVGNFNVRCRGSAAECSHIGGIRSSTPHIASAPDALVRDEGYQQFVAENKTRQRALYVHSVDGVLHAFKANYVNEVPGDPADNRMFAFVPPAVYGEIYKTYPRGERVVLDGPISTKDVVFDRTTADIASSRKWHTALVASLGGGGTGSGGFYALEVTKPELPKRITDYVAAPCIVAQPGCTASMESTRPEGPQFLWQLTHMDGCGTSNAFCLQGEDTSVEPPDPETGLCTVGNPNCQRAVRGRERTLGGSAKRRDLATGVNVSQVQIFGDSLAKPTITTVLMGDGTALNVKHEIGVAIVPHGGDNLLTNTFGNAIACPGPATGVCGGATKLRCFGRAWGTPGESGEQGLTNASVAKECTYRVPGRAVSVVRLDTGEVLRTFAREWGRLPGASSGGANRFYDIPQRLQSKAIHADLRAPVTGTPVVYPSEVGQVAQKAFVTDADGFMWRMDFTDPDASKWTMKLFYDTQNTLVNQNLVTLGYTATGEVMPGGANGPFEANLSQAVGTPILSLDKNGRLIINIATGDQTPLYDITPRLNFVYSIAEKVVGSTVTADLLYYQPLENGERVTGPMTVFDSVHYFATYKPAPGTGNVTGSVSSVCEKGHAYIYGRDFSTRQSVSDIAGGGAFRFPNASTARLEPFTGSHPAAGQVIPGITILASQSCYSFEDTPGDPIFGGVSQLPVVNRPTTYHVFASVGTDEGKTITFGGQPGDGSQLAPPAQRGTYFESWISAIQNL